MFWTMTIRDEEGRALGVVVLSPKTFKSGSIGLFGLAKIDLGNGERYQVQAQAVRIGSRAEADAAQGGQAEPGEDGR